MDKEMMEKLDQMEDRLYRMEVLLDELAGVNKIYRELHGQSFLEARLETPEVEPRRIMWPNESVDPPTSEET